MKSSFPARPVVAVFGDYMGDVYHCGRVTGLSAEVPIPKVAIENVHRFRGGAGNVVENLYALGASPVTICKFNGPYPKKNRLMVGDYQVARWDVDDVCEAPSVKDASDLLNACSPQAIIVSDYGKGSIDRGIQTLLRSWSERCPIYVDAKTPYLYSYATAMFPNQVEFAANDLEYQTYLGIFQGTVVLKKGAAGIELLQGSSRTSILGLPVPVRCVNGAGDSVLAAYVYKALQGANPAECGQFANAAGAVAVSKPYTSTVSLKEIEEL